MVRNSRPQAITVGACTAAVETTYACRKQLQKSPQADPLVLSATLASKAATPATTGNTRHPTNDLVKSCCAHSTLTRRAVRLAHRTPTPRRSKVGQELARKRKREVSVQRRSRWAGSMVTVVDRHAVVVEPAGRDKDENAQNADAGLLGEKDWCDNLA
ncbi:hypothetical protein BDY19DRAFT_24232 [Irpex rosettiformis]|uniref:Uncharacterized protein n=1 Tax=Irpex rosettiformis TaxID=378272 RepID=A0ACB8UJR1_9APHY|nr:hypothetical protein BDY19DRAFT_24232 [Irpex rosettiformis]